MRTKAIIEGFKNSQKFRFILTANSGEEIGMTMTVQQMSEQFATRDARTAVWAALEALAFQRQQAKKFDDTLPVSLTRATFGFRQVQVDLF